MYTVVCWPMANCRARLTSVSNCCVAADTTFGRKLPRFGPINAARMPMMAITVSNSSKVKPAALLPPEWSSKGVGGRNKFIFTAIGSSLGHCLC